ncbi:MAG: Rieske 2Fe-2S domain-containing protein [Mesorhizobium sp.]|nr:Rieske 2Fe-2S domain-containing protein [Mesorhizobium sp.]MCO5163786.1 Rieske 2Fe-2S domain-containing protein [Mesorhizobium sp.]
MGVPARRGIDAREVTAPLCRLEDLAEGKSRGFDPLGEGRDTMFVIRRGGRLYAWRNHCPHYDRARMAWKKDEFLDPTGSRIMCFAHGALFEIDSGECTLGPCLGQHLTAVPVEIRDGQVWVTGVYEPGLRR